MTENIRALIVDDHEIVRQGLRLILLTGGGFDVVGEAADGEEGVELARVLKPDVVLMGVCLRSICGIEATRIIKQHRPATTVIIISENDDLPHLSEAIVAGADAYLRKDTSRAQLIEAIRTTVAGGSVVGPLLLRSLLESLRETGLMRALTLGSVVSPDATQPLTEREEAVARLISRGLSNREIAGELGVAASTVKTHVDKVFKKLNVTDRTQVAIWAVTEGQLYGN